MASRIFNKFKEPKSTEFSKKDLVIDIKGGHLFYKSNLGVHKLVGDTIGTSIIESGDVWTDFGTHIFHDGTVSASGDLIIKGPTSKIQLVDTTLNYVVESIAEGGPRINFGDTDSSTDGFMTIGAFSNINQINTQNRDFHLYSGSSSIPGFYYDVSQDNFGIGTSSPFNNYKLHVSGGFGIMNSGNVGGFVHTNADLGIRFFIYDNNDDTRIFADGDIGSPHVILKGRGTGINVTPDYKLHVDADEDYYSAKIQNNKTGTGNVGNGLRISLAGTTTGLSGNRTFILFENTHSTAYVQGSIGGAGENTQGVNYNSSSDKRLKYLITNTRYSINDLLKIKVRDYKWKDSDILCNGFIAQELNEIYPEAVSTTDNGIDPLKEGQTPWSIDYGKLTPLLVKSIQDQQKQIEELKKEIKKLKNGIYRD